MAWQDWAKRLIPDEPTWRLICLGHGVAPLDARLYPDAFRCAPSPEPEGSSGLGVTFDARVAVQTVRTSASDA